MPEGDPELPDDGLGGDDEDDDDPPPQCPPVADIWRKRQESLPDDE